jgi:hypothetical protein
MGCCAPQRKPSANRVRSDSNERTPSPLRGKGRGEGVSRGTACRAPTVVWERLQSDVLSTPSRLKPCAYKRSQPALASSPRRRTSFVWERLQSDVLSTPSRLKPCAYKRSQPALASSPRRWTSFVWERLQSDVLSMPSRLKPFAYKPSQPALASGGLGCLLSRKSKTLSPL